MSVLRVDSPSRCPPPGSSSSPSRTTRLPWRHCRPRGPCPSGPPSSGASDRRTRSAGSSSAPARATFSAAPVSSASPPSPGKILKDAGASFTPGEEALRAPRLLALIEEDLPLAYFELDLLRSTPGWPEAFAAAISDLEGAGLEPAGLPVTTAAWRDVALLWSRVEKAAGRSWTSSRTYREAAARLASGAKLSTGPVFAAVTGRESAAQARFLLAIPGITLGVVAARPLRPRHLDRLEALFGPDARAALEGAPLPASGPTERDLLARYLFASPELLAAPSRPRSKGPDGTVLLEEHSGVEAEVEAAVEWVAQEVLERKTPLEEVAVLVPVADALAPLVASRIERLPWPGGRFPVHVAGGIPLTATAGGARALSLVRALSGFLSAEGLATVLPSLRAPGTTDSM